ncbi:MAG: (2Fe-2S) ferredoxin domain-containing protein [Ruminiclostridium sp.]
MKANDERNNKMKITVCIGSSCHLKGSRQVVEKLQALIAKNNLSEKIELSGTFCMSNCQKGVCVTLDGQVYSLAPETTESFFETEVLPKF